MSIEELTARLDALEAENNKLKADNLELSGELQVWKPSQRVEIAQPADKRTVQDFASPKANIKQFKLSEAAIMPETELLRAIENHMLQQIPNLANAPGGLIQNMKARYPIGLAKALKGTYPAARKDGYRGFAFCLSLERFGFQPFVGDAELRAAIF